MKTIPLNIMLSYPVKWTKHQVLRDITQNFYDDIGAKKFYGLFKTTYKEDEKEIILSIASKGFSYEWLLHMGASSKQGEPGKYAGLFGEGFKMASLCALRDYNWKIKMRSRDWSLEVCTISTTLDGKPLKQLAYNVTEGHPNSTETILTIQSFSKEDAKLLEEVVLGFYFPENPLFGKCIFENEYAAVYERSKQQKPESMPTGLKLHGEGIVYIGFQARGGFDVPLIICNHRFETKNRDRHDIYIGTIIDMFIDTVDYIDADTSCYLLEKFEKRWYDYPKKKIDVHSWYSLIRKLIRKIAFWEPRIARDFLKRNPDIVVCERSINSHTRNQKTQALIWKKLYLPNARLVQDSFYFLGYESVVYLCEKAGGFNILRKPDINEQSLLKILEEAGKSIFADFFSSYPECLIIENDSSVYNGTANLIKNKKNIYNNRGYLFRYNLINISIKKSSLVKDGFTKAFSTYSHELSHCFGGDASSVFSRALTDVIDMIAKKNKDLAFFNRLWIEKFNGV